MGFASQRTESETSRAAARILAALLALLAVSAVVDVSSVSAATPTGAFTVASSFGYDGLHAGTTHHAKRGAAARVARSAPKRVSRSSTFLPSRSSAAKAPVKRGPKPIGTGAHNVKLLELADSITDGQIIAGGQRGLRERPDHDSVASSRVGGRTSSFSA
jgi:hypothetical protein